MEGSVPKGRTREDKLKTASQEAELKGTLQGGALTIPQKENRHGNFKWSWIDIIRNLGQTRIFSEEVSTEKQKESIGYPGKRTLKSKKT